MRLLLLPFSWVYAAVTAIRNLFFDTGILKSKSYPLPVVSAGNLTAGGTGKTPLTEYILRLLMPNHCCALLSRGYGRKTHGVIIAGATDTYRTIGDEPMQLKTKFPQLTVAVAEKRQLGMEALLSQPHPPSVVVMDDAYQHRYVKAGFSILVIDYNRPVWSDFCLPAGNLREPRKGILRSNAVVVNKCPPDLSTTQAQIIEQKLKLQSHQLLFFTAVHYAEPCCLAASTTVCFRDALKHTPQPIAAVAAIGNPQPFFNHIKTYGKPVKQFAFADHHPFTLNNIKHIIRQTSASETPLIITTEKDAVRIREIRNIPLKLLENIWYIPIRLQFLFNSQNLFNTKIKNYVTEN